MYISFFLNSKADLCHKDRPYEPDYPIPAHIDKHKYERMPTTTHHTNDFVRKALTTTKREATKGIPAGHQPSLNIPGWNKSLATRAAKTAAGIYSKTLSKV